MKIEHNGLLLRIYVAESSRYHGHDMVTAVVQSLASAGIAGAIVFKGIEGFGSHRYVSSERAVDAWADLPMLIEAVDEETKIRTVLPTLEAVLDDALVTLERVQTLLYRNGDASAS